MNPPSLFLLLGWGTAEHVHTVRYGWKVMGAGCEETAVVLEEEMISRKEDREGRRGDGQGGPAQGPPR